MKRKQDKTQKTKGSQQTKGSPIDLINDGIDALEQLRKDIENAAVTLSESSASKVIANIRKFGPNKDLLLNQINHIKNSKEKAILKSRFEKAHGGDEFNNTKDDIERSARKLVNAKTTREGRDKEGMEDQQKKYSTAISKAQKLLIEFKKEVNAYIEATPDTVEEKLDAVKKTRIPLEQVFKDTDIPEGEDKKAITIPLNRYNQYIKLAPKYHELKNAAKIFVETTNTTTMHKDYQDFKKLKDDFYRSVNKLPKDSDNIYYDGIKAVNDTVIKRYSECKEVLRKAHENMLRIAEEKLKAEAEKIKQGATILELLVSVAPKEVQDAISNLSENPAVLKAIESNKDLEKMLLEGGTIQDAILQITGGEIEGTVATAEGTVSKVVNAEKQIAAFDLILEALANQNDSAEKQQAIIAIEFLKTTVSGVMKVQSGEAKNITIVGLNGTAAIVVHVEVAKLLRDPVNTVVQLTEKFVNTNKIMSFFTSNKEAAVLSLLNNMPVSNLVQEIQKQLTNASMAALTHGGEGGALTAVKGSALATALKDTKTAEIKDLSGVVSFMIKISDNSKALVELFGPNAAIVKKQLDMINQTFAESKATPLSAEQVLEFTAVGVAFLKTLSAANAQKKGPIANLRALNEGKVMGSITAVLRDTEIDPVQNNLLLNGGLFPIPSNLALEQGIQQPLPPKTTEPLQIDNPVIPEIEEKKEKDVVKEPSKDTKEPSKDIKEPSKDIKEPSKDIKEPSKDIKEPSKVVKPKKKSPPPVEKKKEPLDLDEQYALYLHLVEQYKVLSLQLTYKAAGNSNYEKVANTAIDLHIILEGAGEEFFKNPSAESFIAFQDTCKSSIIEASDEFKQHRSIWNSMHPILRGIVGVLATMAVIPALVVAGATKQGYLGTFFGTPPKTDSSEKSAELESQLDDLQTDIFDKITKPR